MKLFYSFFCLDTKERIKEKIKAAFPSLLHYGKKLKGLELASLRQSIFSDNAKTYPPGTSTNSFKRPRPDIWTEFFISCRLMTVDGRFRAVWGGK